MQQLLGVVPEASDVYKGYKLRFKILKFLLRNLFAIGVDLTWLQEGVWTWDRGNSKVLEVEIVK